MDHKGIINGLYSLCVWVTKLIYINILWFVFSIMGCLVLGIGPSTAAMYSVLRKWQLHHESFSFLKMFWGTFKKEFWLSNAILYLFLLIGSLLYFDIKFFSPNGGIGQLLLFSLFIVLLVYLIIAYLFIFPVLAHYQLSFWQYIKYSLILPLLRPLDTLLVLVSGFIVYYLLFKLTFLIPFFGVSLTSYLTMWILSRSFEKVKTLHEQWVE